MRTFLIAAALAVGFSTSASAAIVVLDFQGVANPSNSTTIGDFYNGGVSGDGNSGTNYGVTFSDNALAINSYNGCCEPDPGILFFLDGPGVYINYDAGFTTGFSFFYASNTANSSVSVYDGLNGTGNVLGSFDLGINFLAGCGYCVWDPIGVAFAGTARSIGFFGAANFVAFDRVTFGSDVPAPTPVPEPATLGMLIAGLGLMGVATRRRRKTETSA
jgi:hypothetical protein